MIARRDLLLGGLCVGAAVAGTALKPRREVRLLASGKLADLVPKAFGDWRSEDVGDPYAVNGEGTLSAKLYNELLVRQYINLKTGVGVVVLMAGFMTWHGLTWAGARTEMILGTAHDWLRGDLRVLPRTEDGGPPASTRPLPCRWREAEGPGGAGDGSQELGEAPRQRLMT